MALTVYNKRSDDLSDDEYLQLAEELVKRCNIFHGIYDEGDKYRLDFYLHDTLISPESAEKWFELLRASDMHTAISTSPNIICMSCQRIKHLVR